MNSGILSNKVILILSPQAWGKMLLAKHHYAIELANRGNQVYYLNPPDNVRWRLAKKEKRIWIEPLSAYPGLFVINHQLYFPYNLKFHSRNLYDSLIKKQIRDIMQAIPKPVEVIWSFDLGNLFPLHFFKKKIFKIFHPVDEPRDVQAIRAAEGADILFSVTKEIIEKYKSFQIPSNFINHGLADEFLTEEPEEISSGDTINVGMSGNLMRPDLDRATLLQIIKENPASVFNFYGSYDLMHSNIGAADDDATRHFLERLKSCENVKLYGVLKTTDLARELNRMDALLICYDTELDQSKGTNYHKVMEYLSTGKVIISNNITTYQSYPGLVRMTQGCGNNAGLPALFLNTIHNLKQWNSPAFINERRTFAANNTYQKQLGRIEKLISDLIPNV